jgi:hypothetical protein
LRDLTRHFRAGLQIVPSLRDSPELRYLTGTSVPGYRLCRPFGTRLRSYPALPCRATDCAVARDSPELRDLTRHFRAGLQIVPSLRDSLGLRDPTRHFRAGLQIVPSLRDSPELRDLTRHFRAGLQIVPSLRDSPELRDLTRHFRARLQIVPSLGTRLSCVI